MVGGKKGRGDAGGGSVALLPGDYDKGVYTPMVSE